MRTRPGEFRFLDTSTAVVYFGASMGGPVGYHKLMSFRMGRFGTALIWIGLAVLQIGMSAIRLQRNLAEHRANFISTATVMIAIWSLIFALNLIQILFSRLELTHDALRVRNGFSTRIVPYDSIVAIRQARSDGGRLIRNTVELEIARLGAAIYPHEYLAVPVSDSRSFATAIHMQVPQAEYEPA